MLITILINVVSGLVIAGVVDADGNRIFDSTSTSGMGDTNIENYTESFDGPFQETIKPAGSVEDKGDQIYRILDAVSLGFIYKFVNVVDDYMYGFVNILDNAFGDSLNDDVRGWLFGDTDSSGDTNLNFGILKLVISIGYAILGIKLLSGTDVLT